ncbi:YaiI/YqxD family protein [Paenibacillus sp.]|uniref:YaiI/YqxD family protein n=1 Tax=Paenibacillus sp. TaxID=58172 RepID=UPI002D3CC1F8|nr:YaiI/YqxD family protein [Paenibacillus sp.]HZG55872.1 YaiI/YqxD family protein [Paenibacillus sp.]
MTAAQPKIVVDADACPVKEQISSTAVRFGVPVWMVSSYNHRLPELPGVTIFQVDASDQAADLFIANRLSPGDVLVTQDYGLATIGLAKRTTVLSPRGTMFTNDNIDRLLEERHQSAKRRRAGGRTKGPKPFTAEDRDRFLHVLTKVLSRMQENAPT